VQKKLGTEERGGAKKGRRKEDMKTYTTRVSMFFWNAQKMKQATPCETAKESGGKRSII